MSESVSSGGELVSDRWIVLRWRHVTIRIGSLIVLLSATDAVHDRHSWVSNHKWQMLSVVDLFHDSNDEQSGLRENTALAPSRVESSQLIDGVVVESGEKGMEG